MGTFFALLLLAAPIIVLMTGALLFIAPRPSTARISAGTRRSFLSNREVPER
jgi:hypothetical protein